MKGLEDYITDNPFNKDNLSTLIKSFNRETFVPFVGAGPSTILGEPGWKELLNNLCNAFGFKIRRTKLPNGKADYPKTFSNLYKKIGDEGGEPEQIRRIVGELFKQKPFCYHHLS